MSGRFPSNDTPLRYFLLTLLIGVSSVDEVITFPVRLNLFPPPLEVLKIFLRCNSPVGACQLFCSHAQILQTSFKSFFLLTYRDFRHGCSFLDDTHIRRYLFRDFLGCIRDCVFEARCYVGLIIIFGIPLLKVCTT